eukprot:CAMPEP_0196808816 /NCGR_PEP_ID=MMETSP1362-20130617/8801_1 /TAXON_ID=163516 /ORGANISM="Leptocylindrus danicus, Strain CCMP1856" /LENGTH=1073 /DNA_ID=CAMNT_0042183293 /DNA_START=242 /DNA_END=3463 /DNA_ORIENTATION=+
MTKSTTYMLQQHQYRRIHRRSSKIVLALTTALLYLMACCWVFAAPCCHALMLHLPIQSSTSTVTLRISVGERKSRVKKSLLSSRFNTVSAFEEESLPPPSQSPSSIDVNKVQIETTLSALKELRGPLVSAKIKGIGPKTAESLAKMGLRSPLELLFHFPVKVLDRSSLITNIGSCAEKINDGGYICIALTIESFPRGRVAKAIARDDANNRVDVVYFFGVGTRNSSAHSTAFKMFGPPGSKRVVCGKIKRNMYGGRFQGYEILNPDIVTTLDNSDNVLGVEPVYKLTKGVTQKRMASAIQGALAIAESVFKPLPDDLLPASVLSALSWPTFREALAQVHAPQSKRDVGPHCVARKRLAFEELCIQQARLGLKRHLLKYPEIAVDIPQRSVPKTAHATWHDSPLISTMLAALSFELTDSQKSCLSEIYRDSIGCNNNRSKSSSLSSSPKMMRLLQGDVGSGKTIVAYLAGLGCIEALAQRVVIFLTPTTILAEQHKRTLEHFVSLMYNNNNNNKQNKKPSVRVYVEILTGAVKGKQREELLRCLEECPNDEAYFLVGTHALLSTDVTDRIARGRCGGIALAIIDEEQRFGVNQREVLTRVAQHTLYMSATPIPRTIALGGSAVATATHSNDDVVVGTLDVSTLRQRPRGAREVQTSIVTSDMIPEVMKGVERQIRLGAKAFWILPAIGDGEDAEEKDIEVVGGSKEGEAEEDDAVISNVLSRHAALSSLLGPDRVSYVHGRMGALDRENRLRQFANLESGVDVMVGTTVLEVGIDIPWATLLVVERAERFGLSQLHQLRGRIGRTLPSTSARDKDDKTTTITTTTVLDRSKLECHCAIIADSVSVGRSRQSPAAQRLCVLKDTNDGEQIAIADFRIRGPGDVLGTLQSGSDDVYCVDMMAHYGMIVAASKFGRSFLRSVERGQGRIGTMNNDNIADHEDGPSISSSNDAADRCMKKKNSDIGFGCTGEGRLIAKYLDEEILIPLFADVSASTAGGMLLRTRMLFFAQHSNSLDGMADVEAFEALYRLTRERVLLKGEEYPTMGGGASDCLSLDQFFIDFAKRMDPRYRIPKKLG